MWPTARIRQSPHPARTRSELPALKSSVSPGRGTGRERAERFLDIALESDLTAAIIDGLSRSKSFLLLASPEAAVSRWVNDEVVWWLTHRGGRIGFWCCSPAVTHMGRDRRAHRLGRALSLTWSSRSTVWRKDQLIGEHIRQGGRTRRTVAGVITMVLVLLATAVIFAVRSEQQSVAAQQQNRSWSRGPRRRRLSYATPFCAVRAKSPDREQTDQNHHHHENDDHADLPPKYLVPATSCYQPREVGSSPKSNPYGDCLRNYSGRIRTCSSSALGATASSA
jgi:hypothetical protein